VVIPDKKNPGFIKVSMVNLYMSGFVEYDGQIINYETDAQRTITVHPNQEESILITHKVWKDFLNIELYVTVFVRMYDSGEMEIKADRWDAVLKCKED
jgi:hypothetical protein